LATETLGFLSKEMRDEQYRRWKSDGSRGVTKYSTHSDDNKRREIIYVVTRSEPMSIVTQPENSEKKDLTESEKSEKVGLPA
jgi:hypothetical protein